MCLRLHVDSPPANRRADGSFRKETENEIRSVRLSAARPADGRTEFHFLTTDVFKSNLHIVVLDMSGNETISIYGF